MCPGITHNTNAKYTPRFLQLFWRNSFIIVMDLNLYSKPVTLWVIGSSNGSIAQLVKHSSSIQWVWIPWALGLFFHNSIHNLFIFATRNKSNNFYQGFFLLLILSSFGAVGYYNHWNTLAVITTHVMQKCWDLSCFVISLLKTIF